MVSSQHHLSVSLQYRRSRMELLETIQIFKRQRGPRKIVTFILLRQTAQEHKFYQVAIMETQDFTAL